MPTNALSQKFAGLARCITTEVELVNPFTGERLLTHGIWDTGATNSVVTKGSAERLGLKPITRAVVRGVHGEREVNVYYVEIRLGGGRIVMKAQVSECDELSDDLSNGMLVGMDIISHGDLCITHPDGCTVMSFMVPSQNKIDFVEEINLHNRYTKIHTEWARHGNDLCPCGSNKLWKNCHGKKVFK